MIKDEGGERRLEGRREERGKTVQFSLQVSFRNNAKIYMTI